MHTKNTFLPSSYVYFQFVHCPLKVDNRRSYNRLLEWALQVNCWALKITDCFWGYLMVLFYCRGYITLNEMEKCSQMVSS
jgi:hypothetical protein